MADQATNYQCPACTGPLRFDSDTGRLVCDYCGSDYSVEQFDAALAERAARAKQAAAPKAPVWGEEEAAHLTGCSCPSCGALLMCDEATAATSCPYCGNATVLGGQLSGKLKPEYIIPFRLGRDEAVKRLKRFYKGKAFLPKAFRDENHIREIQGVYVPFWLYDADAEVRGAYHGERSESHREGDFIVTNTDHYRIARAGVVQFDGVPVDGSSKMPDAHMDAIEPFDYSDVKPFTAAYLPGFLADRFDEDDHQCAERAVRRMEQSAGQALRQTLNGYSALHTEDEQVDVLVRKAHYALLPVWMLHTRWRGKDFLFAMNGQTGKLVGDLPIDKGRVAAWFAGISLPLMLLMALLLYG